MFQHHTALRAGAIATLLAGLAATAYAETPAQQVDAIFAKYDKPNSPGCAVGVVSDGKLIFNRGYGYAELEHAIPLDQQSAIRVASITKQFTGAAVLLAVQQGKLSLDDDIRKYLPWFPDYGQKITVSNLLHQTSGIRDFINVGFVAGERLEDVHEEADYIATLKRQKGLDFAPGSQWAYSNSNYFLLERILQAATGETLRAFADRNIFKPLGMTETFFGDLNSEVVPNAASAYGVAPDGSPRVRWAYNFALTGAGELVSSVHDLAIWDGEFYSPRVGGEALVAAMRDHGRLNDGRSADYGGGLMFGVYRGLPFEFHNGSFIGFNTNILRFPDQRFTAIVLCNSETAEPAYLSKKIADVFLGASFKEPRPEDLMARAAATDAGQLGRWAGFYRNTLNTAVSRIEVKDGRLVWNGVTPLIPLEPGRFMTSTGRELRFTEDDGVATATVMDSHPPVLKRFTPVQISQAAIAAYAGSYYSEEVRGRYLLEAEPGGLKLTGPGSLAGPGSRYPRDFMPAGADEFYNARVTLRFTRDAGGRLTGFKFYSAGDGPRGVLFQRRAD
jgi:CubicO group peptidase (beta-lactamase class C family)